MNKNLLIRALFLLVGVLCYGMAMAVNITGTVWIDTDGDGIVDAGETGTNFGGPMYVNVVNNTTGAIIASAQVGPAGGYSFTGLTNNLAGHKLVLTSTATNPKGNRVPGAYYVAEDVVGGSNTANQANAPLVGEIALANQAANMQNQNFRMGQQTAFGCLDGIAYQVAVAAGQTESSLFSYNVSSGARTQIGGITPYSLNSLIYSTATDNFLWATVGNSNDIARIGAGSGTVVYDIENLPTASYNVGVELPNAYMLIYGSNAAEFYVVDVDPSRATFLELVDPTNGYAPKTAAPYGTTVSAGFDASDMAYLASTGLGYGINQSSFLTTINPATGAVTTSVSPIAGLPNAPYGGLFSDKAGKLYAFNNSTGGFYRIDLATNTATLLSTSPPSGGNDAASCPNAFVECDTDIPVVPADVTLCPGNTTNFTVAPDGNGPFTYQWQQSTNGGSNWANLQTTPFTGPNGSYSGGGTATLTVTPSTAVWNNYRYRCVITSNLCTTPSSSATMNVYAIPGEPTLVAGTDAPICPADTYDLNRLVAGPIPAGSTLRFYTSSTPSPATLVADPTQAPVGTYYARYENPGCEGPVSQPITITGCLTPFECEDGVAYQVAAAGGETVSTLYAYNVVSGTRTQIAPLTTLVNGLIYSELDNTLWATKNNTNSIVRIAADGALVEYPIANLPVSGYNVGTGLPNGYMLIYSTNQPRYYVIDINPSRATYLRLVDPANGYALQTAAPYGKALTAGINVADLVYEPVTGLIYGVESTSARLVTLNHVTGASTVGAIVASLPTGTSFGAVFADPSGKLYAFANDPGTFHRINPTAATSTLLSTSITSNSNDGASCPNSILENLPFDCADGITYQVAAAAGEPVSTLYAYNVNTGARTEIAPLPMTVNSLIFNSADNMLWATRNGTNSIVQIDREGGTVEYPIANLSGNFNVGVELPNGYMMIYQTNTPSFYVIDVDPNRPSTYLKLVDPTNGFALQTGPTYGVALSQPFAGSDFAYLPSTQLIYGFTTDARISTINPLTGAVTVGSAPVSGLPGNSGFGAVFADATGKLYAFHNDSGRFYKIDPVGNSASYMSTSLPSNSNDGANCVTATLCDIELTKPNPETRIICVGNTTTFAVAATGTGTLAYQWQVSTDGGDTWTDLAPGGATDANGSYSGANSNTLTLTPATIVWNDNRYRVIVDSDSDLCTLTSGTALLSVRSEEECELPVTLVSFSVTKEANSTALLNWATTEETNSDRFEIERSTDAKNWKMIGTVASHGESKVLRKYDFADQAPAAGLNYYRLKMVDRAVKGNEAEFAYSRIASVEFGGNGLLAAYPNPASDRLKFKDFAKVKSVILHNAAGVKVIDRKAIGSEGLDISKLAPGIYTVKLTLADGSQHLQKVIIVR